MNSMNKFLSELEKRADLFEAVKGKDFKDLATETGAKPDDWFYVAKKEFLDGLLKVGVHEISEDRWEILYCAPQTSALATTEKAMDDLMAAPEPEEAEPQAESRFRRKSLPMLNETVEGDNSPQTLKSWYVADRWTGDFKTCLDKCIEIVQGKGAGIPQHFRSMVKTKTA